MASRRNSALKFYVSGTRAATLHKLVDPLNRAISAFDLATQRAVVGLKRRAEPAAKRAVRSQYNLRASSLAGKFKVEEGAAGRRGDKSDFVSLWASTRRIPLMEFGGAWGGRKTTGATATVQQGSKTTYPHAFVSGLRTAGKVGPQIAMRVGAARVAAFGKYAGKQRQKVAVLKGPSPFEMLSGLDHRGSREVRQTVMGELREFYFTEFNRQWKLTRGSNGR